MIDDIDSAIFESSLAEGASELEVVERILSLRQRDAVKDFVAGKPEVMAKLLQLRILREFGITVGKLNPDPASKASLHKWRKAEVVTDEALINRVNSPLSCGDVFQKDNFLETLCSTAAAV